MEPVSWASRDPLTLNTPQVLQLPDNNNKYIYHLNAGPVQHISEGDISRSDPMFAGPINNVTVNVGREAVLECQVNNLRQYKVGWLKAGDQTILALHKRVITHNSRVSVSHEDNRVG